MAATFSHGWGAGSRSAPQLSWRSGHRGSDGLRASRRMSPGLPALGGCTQPPLSFEDMYASAKRRIAKKSADLRQGGPPSPSSSQTVSLTLSSAALQDLQGAPHGGGGGAEGEAAQMGLVEPVMQPLPLLGSGAPEAAADAGADEGLEVEWMESVLSPDAAPPKVVKAELDDLGSRPGSKQSKGDAALERKVVKRKVKIREPGPGSAAAAPDAGEGPPEEPRKPSKSVLRKPSSTSLGEARQSPGDGGQEDAASQPDRASQPRGSIESACPSCGGTADSDDMSDTELDEYADEWRAAFNRYKAPGDNEVHADHLGELLCFLGHGLTLTEHYEPLLSDVTSYRHFDFEEFCVFMKRYRKWERHKMREIFREYDTDGSGEISISELRPLMASLGLVPFTESIREALLEVDDGNAQLGFEELVHFLAVYSSKQGFSSAETKELRLHFDRFAGLDPDRVFDVEPMASALSAATSEPSPASSSSRLLRRTTNKTRGDPIVESVLALHYVETVLTLTCGHQQAQFAKVVVQRFLHTQPDQSSSGAVEGLTFQEFLIVARMIRECQRERLKKDNPEMVERVTGASESEKRRATVAASTPTISRATTMMEAVTSQKLNNSGVFKIADEDGNGSVSISELKGVLKIQGYTALKQVIAEICLELVEGWDIDYELDFDELFDFMMIFHQREGFLKAEVEAFKRVFYDHDEDNSGEVGTNELNKLLRYLGYRHSTSDVLSYIMATDINESGQLDWREFLHLMRRFKEGACEEARTVFEDYSSWVRMAPGRDLEQVMHKRNLGKALQQLGYSAEAVDSGHVRHLLEAFSMLRLDDFIGVLDATRVDFVEKERVKAGFTEEELGYFHAVFDEHDKNKTGFVGVLEMETILNMFGWGPTDKQEQMLLVAKMQTATERARATGMPGAIGSGGETSFWTFVQLLRLLHDEQDRREDAQLRALCAELNFSEVEVDQFHQVFRHYARPNPEFVTGLQRGVAPYLLPSDGARKLIRFLGVPIGDNESTLEQKLASLDSKGRNGHTMLEFWPFLRLMRWLMDTNFRGINDSVANLARLKGSSGDADLSP